MLIELLVIYCVVITLLFISVPRRMERSNDETLDQILQSLSKVKPEKVLVEVDSSPWTSKKRGPVDEEDALVQMWQALCTRGVIGDHADRFQYIFGVDSFNRIPLNDGRVVVWYGDSTPTSIKKLLVGDDIIEEEEETHELAIPTATVT